MRQTIQAFLQNNGPISRNPIEIGSARKGRSSASSLVKSRQNMRRTLDQFKAKIQKEKEAPPPQTSSNVSCNKR